MGRPHVCSEIVCLLCRHIFSGLSVDAGAPEPPDIHSICTVGAIAARIVAEYVSITATVVSYVMGNSGTLQL